MLNSNNRMRTKMKGINRNKPKVFFALSVLSTSLILLSQSIYALQALEDQDLRAVNGQDGLHINTTYGSGIYGIDNVTTGIDIDELYWQDRAGKPNSITGEHILNASAKNIKIRDDNDDGKPLGTDYKINIGSQSTNSGLDLAIETNHSLITVDSFQICQSTGCTSNDKSLGKMAIQSTSPIGLHFKASDGLFSKNGTADFNLGLRNTNIYLGQSVFGSATNLNQLILKNFNFNFDGKGKMYVDNAKGLYLETGTSGYVDFIRAADEGLFSASGVTLGSYAQGGKPTNSGLNLEFMVKANADGTNNGRDLYKLDTNKNPVNAKGLIRVGASGRMVNGYLQVRGTDSTGKLNPTDTTAGNILGFANSATSANEMTNTVMGSTGIGFRMRGEFTNKTDNLGGNATTLEIGGAGLNTYGFEFSNLSSLRSNSTDRAYFDSGNIYVNLADTKTLLMPKNYTFQNSRFGGVTTDKLTSDADYIQNIHKQTTTNPYSVVMAIRGGEFQAISRQGRFTNSATDGSILVPQINEHNDNTWGLALPFYNLNSNIAVYGTEVPANTATYYTLVNGQPVLNVAGGASSNAQRLGFSLAMSTEGIDKDTSNPAVNLGNKTTSILVIDGANNPRVNKPTDYYMGIRNIDMLLKGTGSIGLENGSMNVSLKDMLIVMAGEIAAGYLPGAEYKTCPTNAVRCSALSDNFARKDDALLGMKLRLGGSMDFSLIPNSQVRSDNMGNRLNIVGDFTLDETKKNTIQLSDPADGSILGLDNLSGKLRFNNAIVIGPNSSGEGVVGFHTGLNINPEGNLAGVLRAKDMNFYPASGAAQRLGEMAITGGTLSSRFNITPR